MGCSEGGEGGIRGDKGDESKVKVLGRVNKGEGLLGRGEEEGRGRGRGRGRQARGQGGEARGECSTQPLDPQHDWLLCVTLTPPRAARPGPPRPWHSGHEHGAGRGGAGRDAARGGEVRSPCITSHKHGGAGCGGYHAGVTPGYQRTCSKSALPCHLKAKKTWGVLVKMDDYCVSNTSRLKN